MHTAEYNKRSALTRIQIANTNRRHTHLTKIEIEGGKNWVSPCWMSLMSALSSKKSHPSHLEVDMRVI